MSWKTFFIFEIVVVASLFGCVSMGEHDKNMADLAESCRVSSHSAIAFEQYKQDAEARIQALEEEQTRLGKQFVETSNELTRAQSDLQSANYHLALEEETRRQTEKEVRKLLRQREVLASRVEDLQSRLELREEKLDEGTEVQAAGRARLELLAKDRERLETEWLVAQTAVAQAQERLAAARQALESEQAGRQEADRSLARVQDRSDQLQRMEHEVRRERDALKRKLEDATARLGASRETLVANAEALLAAQREQSQARAALTEAKGENKRLRAALAAEREMWNNLQEALKKVERRPEPPTSK